MIIKNKKGADLLSDLFVYFVFVLTIVAFWMIASHMKGNIERQVAIQTTFDQTKTDFILLLRQQVSYPENSNNKYSVAELIVESQYDDDKKEFLRKFIREEITYKYGGSDKDGSFWNFRVEYPDKKSLKIEHEPIGKKVKIWAQSIWNNALRVAVMGTGRIGPGIIPAFEDGTSITTELPGLEEENIKIFFEHRIRIPI